MDFTPSPTQKSIRETIIAIMADFGDDYWLVADRDGRFPEEFYQAIAAGGWLGIAMPEVYGGAALGIAEAAVMMQTIAESGGGGRRRRFISIFSVRILLLSLALMNSALHGCRRLSMAVSNAVLA